jgi:uncharacterized protein YfeS
MKIWVSIHTYNTYGGHTTLSLIGQYFASGQPNFGSAIRELDINIYFASGEGPKKTLESLHERFRLFIERLPAAKFYRKKAKFEVSYVSRLGDSRLIGYGPVKFDLFLSGAREIAGELSVIGRKLKRSDDFDFDGFSKWIRERLDSLPKGLEELEILKERLDAEAKAERDAMDEWEKLGIDWEDYHPQAREILDQPFYWDCTDDFAPNGNDTGADVLGLYAERKKRTKNLSGMKFLEGLIRGWGFDASQPSDDELLTVTTEEARIGLAFAQLKVDGVCEDAVCVAALDSIAQCRARMTTQHGDWALLDERLRTLDMLECKLNAPATPRLAAGAGHA